MLQRGMLRWYDLVLRKDENDRVKRLRVITEKSVLNCTVENAVVCNK